MRSDASELCVGSAASELITGTEAALPLEATSAIAARAAIARLAEWLTRRLVEEVQIAGVDGDRHLVAEVQLDVRRERRHEIRARADDALLVLGALGERLVDCGRLAADLAGIDLEVGHRLAAERLDELDACRDPRHPFVALGRVQV